jgi:hypothetical protein
MMLPKIASCFLDILGWAVSFAAVSLLVQDYLHSIAGCFLWPVESSENLHVHANPAIYLGSLWSIMVYYGLFWSIMVYSRVYYGLLLWNRDIMGSIKQNVVPCPFQQNYKGGHTSDFLSDCGGFEEGLLASSGSHFWNSHGSWFYNK